MRKIYSLILVALFTAFTGIAQNVSSYTFSQTTSTYSEITGGTVYGTTTSDDQRFVNPSVPAGGTTTTGVGIPIGFDFFFNSQTFDRIGIDNNGWISLGTSSLGSTAVNMSSTSSYTPLSSTMSITPTYLRSRIAALGVDLQAQTGSTLRVQTLGTSPNRTCIIQWKNYRNFNATGQSLNFQIILTESTNTISFNYGTMTLSSSYTTHVGLGGSSGSDYNNRSTSTNWNTTVAGTANTQTCSLTSTVYPASNLLLKWTPPPVCTTPSSQPTSLSLSAGAVSISGSFTSAAGSPSGYLVIRTSSSTAPTNPVNGTQYTVGASALGGVVVSAGSSTNFSSTGLSPATAYYFWVYSFNSVCYGEPYYLTTSPLSATTTTLSCGSGISGIKTIGTGGDYTNLTNAISDLATCGISGPVTLSLLSTYSSSTETFPITINSITGASSTNTITIKPASGVTATITGASTNSIIKLNGADFITIDGSNNGTSSRDLTITNSAAGNLIWVGTDASTGATNNTLKNLILVGPGNFSGQGIMVGSGTTSGSAAENGRANSNNTIQNCSVKGVQNAVFTSGDATTLDQNWLITQNEFGSSSSSEKLSFRGVLVQNAQNATISSNTIFGVSSSTSTSSTMSGILLSGVINGATVTRNLIRDIKQNNTVGWGANGVFLNSSSTSADVILSNNVITDVAGTGYSSATSSDNGYGIMVNSGGGYKIYHNTVAMNTSQLNNGLPASINISSSITTAGSLDIRNNIFSNTQTVGTNRYAIYSAAANTVFSNINNNVYWTGGPNLGYIGSNRSDLAAIVTGFGGNTLSKSISPSFVSSSDLHLSNGSGENWAFESAGTSISTVATDFDGDTRNSTRPDIGADEFSATGFVVNNPPAVCTGSTIDLTAASVTNGTISGTTFTYHTDIAGNNALSNPNAVSTAGTYYIKATNGTGNSWILPVVVSFNPLPTPSITGSNVICANSTGNVYSVTNVTGNTYAWTVTGGTVTAGAGTNSITVTWGAAGTGTIQVLETITATGCTQTNSLSVTINPLPTPSITGSTAVCTTNQGYVYSVPSVAGNTYAWTVTGGTITAGAGTNSITVTWGAAGAGTVAVTQTITATGCATTVSININIQTLPTATSAVVEPVTCASENGQINLTLGGAAGPYTYAWTGTGNGLTATTQNQAAVSTGFYNVTVTAANGCTTSLTNIVVSGPGGCFICPTIGSIAATNTIICQNTNNTISVSGLADLGITYGIQFKYSMTPLANPYLSTAGTVMNTVTNANLTGSGTGASTTYSFPTAGTVYVYAILSPTSPDPACRPYQVKSFVVAATPALTDPTDQVLCTGSTTSAVSLVATPSATTSFAWTNSRTSIGLAASGTGNIAAFTATNYTNAPVTATVVVTPTNTESAGGTTVACVGPTQSFTYTVNPIPTVNTVADQNVCAGTAVTLPFSGFVAGTVFEWTNSNTAIGLAASGTGNLSYTATNTTSSPITATIIVTPKYTNAGVTCTGNPISFTITVNPTPTVAAVTNQVLCNGAATTAVAFTGATTGTVYNWTNSNTSIGLAASGTGDIASFTAVNTGATAATATITVTPTYTGAGFTCTGTATTFTLTVNPTPRLTTVSNSIICNGSSNTIALTGPVTGSVFDWTNSNTAIGLGASGTGNISFTATNAGPDPITATISVTPSVTNAGLTCTGTASTFTVTVNPSGQVNTVTNQVLCNGSATSAVTFSTTNNGLISTGGTQTASSGTISVSVPDASAAGATHTIPVNLPTGAVINNMRVTMNMTHTWISDMVINLKAPNGQILNLFNQHGGSGDNLVNTIVSSAGTTAFSSGSAPFTGTFAATAASGQGPTGNVSNAANFAALYSTPNGNWVLAMRDLFGGDLGVLTSWSISIDYTVQGTFGTNMNWTNSTTSIGLGASGTGNIPSFTAVNNGSAPVTSTVTVTPVYFNGGTSCPGAPTTFTYTVNPTATVNAVANQVFCAGSLSTVNFSGNATGTVYSWTNSNTAIGLAASGTGNLSFTPTNTGTTPIIATITVTPSFTNGGVTCTGTPRTFTITVNPVGQVNAVTSQVLCNGSNTTAVNFATVNGGGTIVAGTPVVTNSGTIAVVVPDANSGGASHTIPVTLPAGATVTGVSVNFNMNHTWVSDMVFNLKAPNGQILNLVNRRGGAGVNFTNTTISSAGTASLATGTAPFTGTFAADAAIGVGPTGQLSSAANYAALYAVGSGDWTLQMRDYVGGDVGTLTSWSITINYTTLVPAVTSYAWTNNLSSIGLAASGTGNIASFAATNTTAAPVTATVTVTPTYNNAGVGCAGTPISYTYTVNPTPTVNAVSNQTVCRGSNVAAVTFTGATTGTVYNWTNSNTAIGLAASGTGNIASFVGTNTTAAPISGTITVTPVYTNAGVTCTGTPRTFTITVNPIPTVNAVANFAACHNTTAAAAFSGATTGTVFNWTNSNPAIGLPASGSGNISFTALNTTSAPVTATITVTPSFTNGGTTCVGTPTSFVITVNPLPVVTTGALPGRICVSDTLVRLNGTPVGGSWSGFGISGFNFMPPATDIGTWPITYTYADANGCVNRATTNVTVLACEERNRDLDNGAVILYPNPNSGQFNLRVNSTRFNVLGMKVYNTSGQLVYTNQWRGLVFARVIPVNLNNLAAGNFMIRLYYGDGMDRGADKTYQVIIAR
jgi:subtilisin-like proprotein convertase family protein